MKRALRFFAVFAVVAVALKMFGAQPFPFSFWKTSGSGSATPAGNGQTFTYASDGDANGVFYFAGKNYTAGGAWTNPHTAGYATIVHTPLNAAGSALSFVNRTLDHSVFTSNVANAFVGVDLGAGRALVPSYYSMRARDDDALHLPRTWKLQGTNSVSANTEAGFNAATWTDLDTRTGDTTMNAASAWGSFSVTGVSTGYRYLRIRQTGANSSGANYFCIQEFELYGTLIY